MLCPLLFHFQAGCNTASVLDEEPLIEQARNALTRWPERLAEIGCVPTTHMREQLVDACAQMVAKFNTLFTVATFDFNDPGAPLKFVFSFFDCWKVLQIGYLQSTVVYCKFKHRHTNCAAR